VLTEIALIVGTAIVLATIVETALRYGSLPGRVPIHVALNGVPDNYGPRPAIWILPASQVFTAVLLLVIGWVLATHAVPGRGHGAGFPIFALAVLALIWGSQRLILRTAITGKVDVRAYWVFFGVTFIIAILASTAL
jgi:hypothetical protein